MPIDPSIPLQVRPIQIADPMESYGRALSLKALIERGKMDAYQLDEFKQRLRERRQDEADDQVVREAFEKLKGDYSKLPEEVAGKVSQKRQLALMQHIGDLEKQRLDLGEKKWQEQKRKIERLGALAASVTDEASLRANVERAIAEGLVPEEQAGAWRAKPWDEATRKELQNLQMQSDVGRQIYEAGLKRFDEERKKTAEQRAAEKHAAEMPGVRAKAEHELRQNAAAQLAAAASAADYKRMWNELPAGVARAFPAPEEWTPQVGDRIRQAGLTPSEQETARHNREMENLRRGQKATEALTASQAANLVEKREEELRKIQKQEADLHDMRRRLASAIGSVQVTEGEITGGSYLDDRGTISSLTSNADQATLRNAVSDMIQRYRTATEEAKRVIADKNKLLQRSGASVAVSTEQAHRELDAGSEAVEQLWNQLFPTTGQRPEPKTAPPPPSTPAQPSNGRPPKSAGGAQRIRVRLSDGRQGTILASEFDPKTMTKL